MPSFEASPAAARSSAARRWLRLLPVLGIPAMLALVFADALAPGQMLLGHDAFQIFLPLKQYLARELAAGHWPGWYPYDGLGVSVPGSFVPGLFDLMNLLLLIASPAEAVKWSILLGLLVAAFGASALARALQLATLPAALGGLAFALSGVMVSQTTSLQYEGAFSRAPWALWAALQLARTGRARYAAVLAVALASIIWVGDPETFLVATAGTVVLVALQRRGQPASLPLLLLAGMLTTLLCAPIVLPALRIFTGSGRAAALAPEEALSWSLHPVRLAELLLGSPFAYASKDTFLRLGGQSGGFWSDSIYAGTGVVLLAACGLSRPGARRLRGGMAALLALAAVLSLGHYAGLYAHVPGLMHFRYPEKLVVWVALPLALLAARGLAQLRMRTFTRVEMLASAAGLLAIGLAAAAVERGFARELVRAFVVLGALATLSRMTSGRARMALVAAMAVGELALANRGLLLHGPVARWLPARSPVPEIGAGERLCSDLDTAGFAFPHPGGGWPQERQAQLATLANGLPGLYGARSVLGLIPVWPAPLQTLCSVPDLCDDACARVEGARYRFVQLPAVARLLETGEYRLLRRLDDPQAALLEDLRAPPYAAVRPAKLYGDDVWPVLVALHDRTLDPDAQALLRRADAPGGGAWTGSGEVKAIAERPDLLRLDARASAPGVLVVHEAFSPDWRATVDGAPAPVLEANLAMIGVPVPGGAHRVTLAYRPWGGAWAYLAYALGGAGVGFAATRGRRRKG